LLRVREFIMKDSYSFDRDREGLDRSFELHAGAYHRIFERCEVESYEVVAESGVMGGRESKDFLAPGGAGENELVRCENGDYAADREAARGVPRRPDFPERLDNPEEIETPGVETIDQLAGFLGIDAAATSKAMPVVTTDGVLVLGLVRGDDRLNEEKLMSHLGMGFRPATDDEIREKFGAGGGSLGPVGVQVEVVADDQLREGQYVTGANRDGFHLRGVEAGRDFAAEFADIRVLADGDRCPECGGTLIAEPAMELGHIFKLETYYSERFGATYLDEHGQEQLLVMGSYGIGPARTMAAIIEQHHDEHGITWPASVAPYDAHVVVLPGVEAQGAEAAFALDEAGLDVLVDDRDQRAGEKFADADLIGCPIRVTVGRRTAEDEAVDVRDRASGEEVRVAISDLPGMVAATR
jgi:prolyl-tRNA synthetase